MKLTPQKLPTLLLVTASPIFRAFFETIKDRLDDYAIIYAESENEAIQYLNTTFISFIVIDDKTPEIELIPLCQQIRSHCDYEHTPILIITGHLKKSFTRNLLKAGATDFLREPLDEDEFIHRMEMATGIMDTQQKMTALSTRMEFSNMQGTSLKDKALMNDQAIKIVEKAFTQAFPLALLIIEIDDYFKLTEQQKSTSKHALEDHVNILVGHEGLFLNQKEGKFAAFILHKHLTDIIDLAKALQEQLRTYNVLPGLIQREITLSIGAATLDYVKDTTKSAVFNLQQLMSSAEAYLVQAKTSGNTIISQPQNKEIS